MNTVKELVEMISPSEIVSQAGLMEKSSKDLIRDWADLLFDLRQLKNNPPVPGHEKCIVGIHVGNNLYEPMKFDIFSLKTERVQTVSFVDHSLDEVAQIYVSDLFLHKYPASKLISGILYSLCYMKFLRNQFYEEYISNRDKGLDDPDNHAGDSAIANDNRVLSDIILPLELINNEMLESFGQMLYWGDIILTSDPTEAMCKKVLSFNTPYASKLVKVNKYILQKEYYWGDEYGCNDSAAIVVEPYTNTRIVPPLIFVQNEAGERTMLYDMTIDELLEMPLVIKNRYLLQDSDALRGTLLMYLAYPHRMQRELKESAVARLAKIISCWNMQRLS